MIIKRDKPFSDYTPPDFVKYFSRKFKETYNQEYPIIFARDCTLVSTIMDRFDGAKKLRTAIFIFIDKMFEEYPLRKRTVDIDIAFLVARSKFYLYEDGKPSGKNKSITLAELSPELKTWLETEKKKWSGVNTDGKTAT